MKTTDKETPGAGTPRATVKLEAEHQIPLRRVVSVIDEVNENVPGFTIGLEIHLKHEK